MGTSIGNELSHHPLPIPTVSHIGSYVTVANQILYAARKPTKRHQTLLSPRVILKTICAGIGWIWLARLQLWYSI